MICTNIRIPISAFLIGSALSFNLAPSHAAVPDAVGFNILKPSTTGIPGEEVRVMVVDPQGNLWIAARWPFWSECALAMLTPEQQIYVPQAGGGFDTGTWKVWSNVHHPIPSPYIDSIRFTPNGIAWIGSEGGLTRFDHSPTVTDGKTAGGGQMWHTWNTSNSPLMVNGVRSISVDSAGDLWILNRQVNTLVGGIFRYSPTQNAWTHFPIQGGNFDFAPTSVMASSDGFVYTTHEFKSGFSKLDPATGVWTYQPGGTNFSGIMRDQQGNLWFGGGIGGLGGLWKWNGTAFQSWPLEVTGLSRGLDGTVYVSTWDGPIYKMIDGNTPEFWVNAQGLPRSVIQRPNGDFFINNYGSTMALGRVRQYDSHGQLLRRMNTYNCGLPDYFIDNIQRDRNGNMWFACGEGGLSRMDGSDGSRPTRWRNWGDHNDQCEPYPWAGNEPMYAMWEDPDGFIWMGGNGVGKWNPQTGTFVNFWNWQNSSLGVESHTGFARDRNGHVWVATAFTGIRRLNTQSNDWEVKQFGLGTANEIAGLVSDTEGNLWVATRTMLHFFNGETWFAIGPWHGSPVEWPSTLLADPTGGVWIGASNGLIRYKDAQWTLYNTSNSPMPVNQVLSLDIRDDGLLAMTVRDGNAPIPFPGGVVLFDRKNSWRVFQYGTHPFPHHQLGDLSFDGDGDVWISTISEGVTEIVLEPMPIQVPGDVTGDGAVNVNDLLAVINSWGACPSMPQPCPADVAPHPSGDNIVNVNDLLMVINNWS